MFFCRKAYLEIVNSVAMKKRVEFFFIQKQYEKYTTEDNEYVRKVLTECLFKIVHKFL